jgi:hypothetical protein
MSYPLIHLTFVGIQMLDVALVNPAPTLDIDFASPAALQVEMVREVPALDLILTPRYCEIALFLTSTGS